MMKCENAVRRTQRKIENSSASTDSDALEAWKRQEPAGHLRVGRNSVGQVVQPTIRGTVAYHVEAAGTGLSGEHGGCGFGSFGRCSCRTIALQDPSFTD